MKNKTPEGVIVKAIADYLQLRERKGDCFFFLVRNTRLFKRDGQMFVRKMNGGLDKTGIPDIVGCYKSRWLGFEVKANTKQSDTQKQFESAIKKAGGHYYVVRSIDDVIRALAEVDLTCNLHGAFQEIINERVDG